MTDHGKAFVITGAGVHVHGRSWDHPAREVLVVNGSVHDVRDDDSLSRECPFGAEVVHLPGGRLIPAFFDAHLHLDQGGRYLGMLALRDATSGGEVLEKVRAASRSGEGWLVGIGLRETAWPTIEDFHRASRGRPTFIYTRDYHSALVNQEAVRDLGLSADTKLPEGGWQELDDEGRPLGILRENAVAWAEERLPKPGEDDVRNDILRASDHLRSMGVLGVSDAGLRSSWPVLKQLHESGKLGLRVEHWLRCLEVEEFCFRDHRPYIGERLRRTRIKTFIDGALGSRTAWMLEDYSDKPGWRARPVPDKGQYRRFVQDAVQQGWSHTTHAIGDAGVQFVFSNLAELPAPGGLHRIEHVQHIDTDTLKKLAGSGLVRSIQPVHRREDLGMLVDRVGEERAELAFPQRSLDDGGTKLVLGTDWPVVSADPRATMHAAMEVRKPHEGMPGEELTLERALFGATEAAAVAAGFERVGAISRGYSADLVWFAEDPGRDADAWRSAVIGAVWADGDIIVRGEAWPGD